ncbi:MAG: thermonuclease family protein [Staphylococcus epidermidis]|nr:thermonuclease family protein [Staphylococcus epidermidis]
MKSKKMSSLLVVAMIGIIVIIFQFVNHSGPFSGSESQHQSDNSNLNGKDNTPVQPYGKQASNYTKKYLTHQNVYLEYDKEKTDRYGRTLAYVWLKNGDMLNESLVKKGLAREKYFSPNGKYRNTFVNAQEEAKKRKLNIWS